MAKIALGVTSSISIYKACEILRGFQKREVEVQVMMTGKACRFISPYLFSVLSGRRTIVDPFEEEYSGSIDHVALAGEVSLFLVAPATANIIAKFASGVADDFISTFYLAVRAPVVIAPAMNEAMYLHPQTQANIRKLKSEGVEFVEPERGYLACEEEGWGRLASVERIVDAGLGIMAKAESLKGKTVLITAGPTREFLDPVRFLSNRSSGKMGYELAAEALRRGAEVILISGPTHIIPPPRAKVTGVQTAAEMKREAEKNFAAADIVIMAAAVSDFRFEETARKKIKKKEISDRVRLVRTEDILAGLGRKKERKKKILVGFAAETENLRENALRKLREKKLDLVVANDVSEEGVGFESDLNRATIIGKDGSTSETPRASKREVGRLILDKIEGLLGKTK